MEYAGRSVGGRGRRVVVIGGGVAGTSLVVQLMASRDAAGAIASVDVVEPRAVGWGLAFGDDDPLLMCNSAVNVNSLRADRPDDFAMYLRECGWTGRAGDVVPRGELARYCERRFRAARRQAARWGIPVRHVRGVVTSVRVREEGYRVVLRDGTEVAASDVVVCVGVHRARVPDGFAAYTDHPRYVASPYPSRRLRGHVPADSRVLVLGTRQSAIDAALLLCGEGHQVTMASRSGRLPAVREALREPPAALPSLQRLVRLDPTDPLLAQRLTRLAVEAIRLLDTRPLRRQTSPAGDSVERLRQETTLAESGACAWAEISVALIEAVIELFPTVRPERRGELLERFAWFIDRYLTAMTTVNARRLLRHLSTGALRVSPAYPRDIQVESDGWHLRWPSGARESFDVVVNATGFELPWLYWDGERQALLLDRPSPDARVVDRLDDELRLTLRPARPPERIWVAGVATHVRVPFSNHLRNVVRQAGWVAGQLSRSEGAR
ncbi:FAD/NAD(P)-binding protein [Streptomyces sp. NPDC050856]|uniref:FAD/NAD(P)-binding protein n=1 Tax=Streptomyces sp. NPDC050856 TaxID=3154939 RepID=UPI0033E54438